MVDEEPVISAALPTPRLPHTPLTAMRMPVPFHLSTTMASPTGW